MARVLDFGYGQNLVDAYKSGLTVFEVGEKFGCKAETVCRWMARLGCPARTRRKDLPVSEIVACYIAGESTNSLAKRFGVPRASINLRLKERGIELRSASEAECVKWSRMSEDLRAAQVVGAHSALKGKFEDDVADALRGAGFTVDQQTCVGPYNIDLTIGDRIAVEVSSYSPGMFVMTKSRQRVEYLLGQGWLVIYLRRPSAEKCNGKAIRHYFSMPFVLEQLVPLLERASRDESIFGKHRVILCHPKYSPRFGYNLEGLPIVV